MDNMMQESDKLSAKKHEGTHLRTRSSNMTVGQDLE
jgi:hypothetical protein